MLTDAGSTPARSTILYFMKHTTFITLTDMWSDQNYTEMCDIIRDEKWPSPRIAEFTLYMVKYLGFDQAEIFCKLL